MPILRKGVNQYSRTEKKNPPRMVRDRDDYDLAWDGDGRCFRDCTWNYDKIMALANFRVQEDLGQVLAFEEFH